MKRTRVLEVGSLVLLVAGLSLGACGGHSSNRLASGASSSGLSPTDVVSSVQADFVAVVNKVRPSVVEITTSTGLGSGVVYDGNGDIVTNDHVVGTARNFQVSFFDGQVATASLVGAFPPDDLAVIRVHGVTRLHPAVFADSSQLQVGDIDLAIGNPLGLASSVTEGIVSFTGRTVGEGNGVVLPDTIQTSAAINPGNSGGALVDTQGRVIGIPTLAATDPELGGSAANGIGFAIPSNTVELVAPQLITAGRVANSGRAALGISRRHRPKPGRKPGRRHRRLGPAGRPSRPSRHHRRRGDHHDQRTAHPHALGPAGHPGQPAARRASPGADPVARRKHPPGHRHPRKPRRVSSHPVLARGPIESLE